MKKLLLAILFFSALLVELNAQTFLTIQGFVDDSTQNRKIFIRFLSNCAVLDTAKTYKWNNTTSGYSKTIAIPYGCNYGTIRIKMVNCFGDTIERLDYYDATRFSDDTLLHNFKYCDSCGRVSANFSASRGSLTVNFTNYSNKANKYTWLFGDSTTSSSANPTKTYSGSGYYTVCLIAKDTVTGCSDTFCKTIPVGPVCNFFYTYFTHSYVVNKSIWFYGSAPPNANKFKWNFGDSTSSTLKNPFVHTYSSYGTKTVCFTAWDTINNCKDSQCYNVNIPLPCASFHAGFVDSSYNPTKTSYFTDTSGPNSNKFKWYFGDSTTSSSQYPSHTYSSYGTFTVCQVAEDTVKGCKDSVCRNIVITNPCSGFTAGFTDSSAGRVAYFTNTSSSNANKFSWTFGSSQTSITKNPINTYAANGTYNVCLVARDTVLGCKDSVCHNVSVFSCSGFTVPFTDSFVTTTYYYTAFAPSNAHKFLWLFGDSTSSTLKNPVHTFSTPGTYAVKLYAWDTINGCSSQVTSITTVTTYTCSKFYSSFSQSYNQMSPALTNWSDPRANWFHWDFGDGNTSSAKQPGSHTYSTPGTYLICLVAKDSTTGCADTMCSYITVASCASFAANFNFTTKNDTAVFTNTTSYPAGFPPSYVWNFGDGKTSTLTSGLHKYTKSGVYNVCLKASSNLGCKDSICKTVAITSAACSTFTAGYTHTAGYAQTIAFNNTSTSTADLFYWDFGNGATSTSKNPVYQYPVAGTYNVCMVAIDTALGCIDTVCQSVTASLCAGFAANFSNTITGGMTANFTNTSSSQANSFTWNFGDGNTSSAKNPTNSYASTDTFNVCLIAKDTVTGCADTVCKNIIIVGCGHVVADFAIEKDSCMNVHFRNNSSGATSTTWYFGDNTQFNYIGSSYSTSHKYASAGTYTVCLVAKDTINGCKDSTCLNGVVVGPGITGWIFRDSGQIADSCIVYLIQVTIDTAANDTILTAIDSTYSNGYHGYIFSNVPYGNYLVKAALLPGSAFYANRIPTYYGNQTLWRYASTITVNSACSWNDIILTTGTNPGGSGFIGGYVSVGANKFGDPLEKIQVTLYHADGTPFGYTYTDANGEYRFDNLLYGNYKVIVEIPGKPCEEVIVSVSAGTPAVNHLDYEVNTKDITRKMGASGIAEAGNTILSVYPNPAGSEVTVGYMAGAETAVAVKIYDVAGKQVLAVEFQPVQGYNTHVLDVSNLVNGFYMITINAGNNSYINKLVINK